MMLQEHYDEKYNEGYADGLKQGIEQGIEQVRERGRLQEIVRCVKDGDISLERGAQKAGMSLEQFQAAMAETKL